VHDFWTKQVFRKFENQDKINLEDVLERFPQAIGEQREHWHVPQIDGTSLRDRCAKVGGGTHGLDGWRKKELLQLPLQWWDAMAHLFNQIEENGTWPEGLAQASVPHTHGVYSVPSARPALGPPELILLLLCEHELLV
jgi:hypothetical protein